MVSTGGPDGLLAVRCAARWGSAREAQLNQLLHATDSSLVWYVGYINLTGADKKKTGLCQNHYREFSYFYCQGGSV